ncbi:hypothetical protein J2Y44_001633 [Dyadobacter sp. BE32]|uniref:Platelet-activating factor acetylhydrolase plasma/intracellular n=1 Tax=Dyadobacter fermentans TaxID=94254 RepID=A0ABU1QV07_9BACT|nr:MULTISPECIES: hypothetical protein [Dyadobacter]MDR6804590.1 hypothetical protein [Dyadobacter fermentans]MDR7214604.1 hypothetical protein [Dyadobacter sp. BE31]MDR7262139.1 hypothetical protein [Dyadobacter sp. BE32]
MADIWYPAEQTSQALVPYLDTTAIKRALGERGLSSFLVDRGVALIRSGSIRTHARENAHFNRHLKRAPVIFFSHGMGMITQLYTAQIEDLASHGYIVVALSHPYDAWLVSFSDGRQIIFETKQRKAAGSTELEHIAYENQRIEWWAADIRFALDRLFAINGAKPSATTPIAGHMDLARVGAMGHSSGGRAAARACQLDPRIKSCADQDGVAMMQPFYLTADGRGMAQTFLLFERVRNVPPDENDAASLGMTLVALNMLVDSLRDSKKRALAATGGSFHVLLRFDSTSHMSFSDLPLLQAESAAKAALAVQVLQTTCRYTREFFDKTLGNSASVLYDRHQASHYIDLVEYYPKKQGEK